MLQQKHIYAIRWAIREAAAWRGSLTGNPDPLPLKRFDSQVAKCREALRKLVKLYKGNNDAQTQGNDNSNTGS